MRLRNYALSLLSYFLFATITLAQESPLTISETKAEPSTVSPGAQVLISCSVNHPDGPMFIERVAATISHGEWNTSYPMLYDDGTHGDKVPDDGIYSLEIEASYTVGEEKIVFIAVDRDKNEIESEPVILTVK